MIKNTPISEIMNRHVICGSPYDSLQDLVGVMTKNKLSSVVINLSKKPVGIVTERDVIQLLEDKDSKLNLCYANEVMTQSFHVIHENDTLNDVLELATKKRTRHFPVVNDLDELEGIISQTDLAEHFLVLLSSEQKGMSTEELLASNQELKAMALEDPLLGIGNRRAMETELDRVHSQFIRYGNDYIIALIDVDHFKCYNDHFGHLAGDRALRIVSDTLKGALRKSDSVFRYGGEEFLIILQHISPKDAEMVTSRMCEQLVQLQVPHPESPISVLSISGGLSHCNASKKEVLDWRHIVSEADDRLYLAKERGRNRIQGVND